MNGFKVPKSTAAPAIMILDKVNNPRVNSIKEELRSLSTQVSSIAESIKSLNPFKMTKEDYKLQFGRLYTDGFRIRERIKEKIQEAISVLNSINADESIISMLTAEVGNFSKMIELDRQAGKTLNLSLGGKKTRKTKKSRSRKVKKTRKH
jgi:hypothetical protein